MQHPSRRRHPFAILLPLLLPPFRIPVERRVMAAGAPADTGTGHEMAGSP